MKNCKCESCLADQEVHHSTDPVTSCRKYREEVRCFIQIWGKKKKKYKSISKEPGKIILRLIQIITDTDYYGPFRVLQLPLHSSVASAGKFESEVASATECVKLQEHAKTLYLQLRVAESD